MKIKPFKAIRYNQKKVPLPRVVAPPYDIISLERQEELYELHPYNLVRLILSKEHPTDSEKDNRYTRAATDFNQWLKQGILRKDEEEAFYVYEQAFTYEGKAYARTGLIARVELRELGDGIYPHEKTMMKAKEDRYRLTIATKANFDPVFALYESNDDVRSLLASLKQKPADIDIVDDRGIGDRIWIINDKKPIADIRASLEGNDIFIADGHHRYETALRYYKDNSNNPEAGYVMMMLVEMSDKGLVILPAHRVVSLGDKSIKNLLKSLEQNFNIDLLEPELELALKELKGENHNFIMVIRNRFYKLKFKNGRLLTDKNLDVPILHQFVLKDILKIEADQVENRVLFTKNAEEAIKLALAPQTAAFLLKPTPLSALKRLARAHKTMPQKSTYFYPKLLSGLVINSLE